MVIHRYRCAACGWRGTEEQLDHLPGDGEEICPACGSDELDQVEENMKAPPPPFNDYADAAKSLKVAGSARALAGIYEVSDYVMRTWLRRMGVELPRGGNHNPRGIGGTGGKTG